MFGFTRDALRFAAFMRILIRHDQAGIKADLCVQPTVTMRWISLMVFSEKNEIVHKRLQSWRRMFQPFLPLIKAASVYAQDIAEFLDRESP